MIVTAHVNKRIVGVVGEGKAVGGVEILVETSRAC